ncbi:hypothetical protein FWG86_01980 [Candidatus Saccharibacteria bacterium]|nr:hypothetical protein [Candidatus Saccharibacteria bacterium]
MKNHRKRLFSVLLALVLTLALATPAFAATLDGNRSFSTRELEITIDAARPLHYWTANETRGTRFTPYVDVRDVAQSLGGYHVEFATGGQWYLDPAQNEWVWLYHDTYVIYPSSSSRSTTSNIRSDTKGLDLTWRTICIWQPYETTSIWRSVYEVQSTRWGGGFLFSIYDIPLLFPTIETVELAQNSAHRFRLSTKPIAPPFDPYQERPNDAKATGVDLVQSLYRKVHATNVSANTAIQWAFNLGLFNRNYRDNFLDRTISQAATYTILAAYFSDDTNWDFPCVIPLESRLLWATSGINRAWHNNWFYYDYDFDAGLSHFDLDRLIDRAFVQEKR